MKKSFMTLIVSSFLLIFMSGCENTYLSCSKTVTDSDDIKINDILYEENVKLIVEIDEEYKKKIEKNTATISEFVKKYQILHEKYIEK